MGISAMPNILPVNVAANGSVSSGAASSQGTGDASAGSGFAALLALIGGNQPGATTALTQQDSLENANGEQATDPLAQSGLQDGLALSQANGTLPLGNGNTLLGDALRNGLEKNSDHGQQDEDDTALNATDESQAGLLALLGVPQQIDLRPQAQGDTAGGDELGIQFDRGRKGAPEDFTLTLQANDTPADSANLAATDAHNGAANAQTFAQTLHAASTAAKDASAIHQTHIGTAFHDNNWSQALGERVTWLAKQDIQTAEIHLNPPQLGPVQISLTISGDQASASFAAANADVRHAIENSLPQLREMLASSGLQLGNANVGAQLQQQARDNPAQFANGQRSSGEDAILPVQGGIESAAQVTPLNRGRGMVDLFA